MGRGMAFVLATLLATALLGAGCGDGPDETATGVEPTSTSGPMKLTNPVTTASGLKYIDQVVGTGAAPRPDQLVTVHYRGRLAATGAQFDSSFDRGQPATFRMSGVIKGFSEGLSTMKVGGKRTILIPAALGYGAAGGPGIPGNADLVFDVALLAVSDAPAGATPAR
ncbi:MAG: FKBP-type peptidyl-prolyl cis-trans isomerase [Tepidiformaceae bacterium]